MCAGRVIVFRHVQWDVRGQRPGVGMCVRVLCGYVCARAV